MKYLAYIPLLIVLIALLITGDYIQLYQHNGNELKHQESTTQKFDMNKSEGIIKETCNIVKPKIRVENRPQIKTTTDLTHPIYDRDNIESYTETIVISHGLISAETDENGTCKKSALINDDYCLNSRIKAKVHFTCAESGDMIETTPNCSLNISVDKSSASPNEIEQIEKSIEKIHEGDVVETKKVIQDMFGDPEKCKTGEALTNMRYEMEEVAYIIDDNKLQSEVKPDESDSLDKKHPLTFNANNNNKETTDDDKNKNPEHTRIIIIVAVSIVVELVVIGILLYSKKRARSRHQEEED